MSSQPFNMIEIGKLSKFYNPRSAEQFEIKREPLEIWSGFKTAVDFYEGN
jgi:hypothetical protein